MGYKRSDPSPYNGWVSLLSPDGLKAGGWDPGQPFRESQYWPGWEIDACRLPAYSTDIAAAWKVVEKLKQPGRPFRMWTSLNDEFYEATFNGGLTTSTRMTAPMAICCAALQAVGRCS